MLMEGIMCANEPLDMSCSAVLSNVCWVLLLDHRRVYAWCLPMLIHHTTLRHFAMPVINTIMFQFIMNILIDKLKSLFP